MPGEQQQGKWVGGQDSRILPQAGGGSESRVPPQLSPRAHLRGVQETWPLASDLGEPNPLVVPSPFWRWCEGGQCALFQDPGVNLTQSLSHTSGFPGLNAPLPQLQHATSPGHPVLPTGAQADSGFILGSQGACSPSLPRQFLSLVCMWRGPKFRL